jgi:hypothetical protein
MTSPGIADGSELLREAEAFVATLDGLYGLYLDATSGFHLNADRMLNAQKASRGSSKLSIEQQDEGEIFIGRGAPTDPTNVVLHKVTQAQYKARNSRGGNNEVRLGQLLVVLMYEFWETEHRANLSKALGMSGPKDLQVMLMGDLRLLRHDVIHRRGIVSRETVKGLKILTGFTIDSHLVLNEDQVESLVRSVKAEVDDLVKAAGLPDPEHRKIWRVT